MGSHFGQRERVHQKYCISLIWGVFRGQLKLCICKPQRKSPQLENIFSLSLGRAIAALHECGIIRTLACYLSGSKVGGNFAPEQHFMAKSIRNTVLLPFPETTYIILTTEVTGLCDSHSLADKHKCTFFWDYIIAGF